ncbi:MAG TPA: UDP-glucose/GDP-mannose dehydrogenase family protein [Dermatophilaceae bacterium]|nr:UDP-glucose/GDP-mannose dehydrogenase family protein [Dermatophilaceae bacterium]
MGRTISVIGTGYLGAVHAVCMADLGHQVVGVDVDEAKVTALAAGRAPLFEPGLDAMLERVIAGGRLTFTTDWSAVAGADVHFVCVGTPQTPGENSADVSFVDAALDALGPLLHGGSLVVGKSTVPVGTAARLLRRLHRLAPRGVRPRLAWNPEFLREGFAIEDTLRPDRFVYGVEDPASPEGEADVALLDEVYAVPLATGTPRLVTDYATAELVKVAANAFLATKISFINAMSEVCEAAGADVVVLADAIGHDDRIGRKFLGAGVGFGGGCLPKDIRAFMARAGELGADQALTFLREVDAINHRRRARMVDLAREACGGTLAGRTVAVMGAAFKPNSDDIRDSPALDVAEAIQHAGAAVRVHDPKALPVARVRRPGLDYRDTVAEAVQDADVVLHLTEWQDYRDLDPTTLRPHVGSPVLIDGRNTLDPATWRAAGWTYRALGRPRV